MFLSGAFIIISSCGENSTTANEATRDSTASAPDNTNTSVKSVDVPATTRASFETKYPNASNVTWSYYDEPYHAIDWEMTNWPVMDQNDYLVRYNWEGADYYAWYDQDGNWVGSTAPVTNYSGLPSAVNNTVKKQFEGYEIVAIDKENDKDREAYEIDLEKGNDKAKLLVAADGSVLKKKINAGGEKTKEKAEVK